MADAQRSPKKSGLTRGKAVVIAVLAVVLAVILYVQFGSADATASSESKYRASRASAPSLPQSTESAVKDAAVADVRAPAGSETFTAPIIDETRWKSPELTSVIAYDPFALPAKFPQPAKAASNAKADEAVGLIAAAAADDAKKLAEAVEKLRMQLEELKQRGVHVIVREQDQYMAMIGDRMLHVGDEINGFTVTGIDPNGVHVERKKSP